MYSGTREWGLIEGIEPRYHNSDVEKPEFTLVAGLSNLRWHWNLGQSIVDIFERENLSCILSVSYLINLP